MYALPVLTISSSFFFFFTFLIEYYWSGTNWTYMYSLCNDVALLVQCMFSVFTKIWFDLFVTEIAIRHNWAGLIGRICSRTTGAMPS